MTEPTTPAPAPDDAPLELPVEIMVQASADGRQGWLVLAPIGGGDTLEVPLTRADAVQLIAALAEYAYPGCRLRAAAPAGRA